MSKKEVANMNTGNDPGFALSPDAPEREGKGKRLLQQSRRELRLDLQKG